MMAVSDTHYFTELSWSDYKINFRIVFCIACYQFGISHIKTCKSNFVKHPIFFIYHCDIC